MDAVILAAGRGTRVDDAADPYMKPLLVVDGEPLVVRAVKLARPWVERSVVVASPRNAELIVNALDEHEVEALVVIQARPRGPGHALLWGLSACGRSYDDRVLVLISTDVSAPDDVAAVLQDGSTAVGVRLFTQVEAAERYTFFDFDHVWREKEKPRTQQLLVECWVGLFVGSRSNMHDKLLRELHARAEVGVDELPIGPYLTDFMYQGRNHLVYVSSKPIKTADDYRRIVKS